MSSPIEDVARNELANHNLQLPSELQKIVQCEEREMYIGGRRTKEKRQVLKEMWAGTIQDLRVGSMVVVLAENDPDNRPFWVAKVRKVITSGEEIVAIEVHWYRTKACDAFTGHYEPEMIVGEKKGGKKKKGPKNQPRLDILNLADVDILVYDFDLTQGGFLCKSTKHIIAQKLPKPVLQIVDASSSKKGSKRRLDISNIELDSDGVMVDSMEEDGSTTSSRSKGDIPSDDMQAVGSDDDFE